MKAVMSMGNGSGGGCDDAVGHTNYIYTLYSFINYIDSEQTKPKLCICLGSGLEST